MQESHKIITMNAWIALGLIVWWNPLLTFSFDNSQFCSSCNPDSCEPPIGCLAGLVKDVCNCCYECGRKEGERCDHEELIQKGFGICGENLDCRLRTDLDADDTPEATCFCSRNYPLCGSDGKTYENLCHLTEERYKRRDGLRAISREPCNAAPEIVSHSVNARNLTGSYVALHCDTVGWPLPEITWQFQHNFEEPQALPGNSSNVFVLSTNGPHLTEKTGWLLFTRLVPEHKGTYVCAASNSQGEIQVSIRVEVIDRN